MIGMSEDDPKRTCADPLDSSLHSRFENKIEEERLCGRYSNTREFGCDRDVERLPMKLEKFSSLLEAVSSVAVVVTLIILIVEIRQNTEALDAQSRQSVLLAAQTELLKSVDHPEMIAALSRPGPLTAEENIQIDAYFTAAMRSREFSWLQFRSGLIDEGQWQTELAVIRSIMSSPRIRLWWRSLGRTYVSADFARFVDDLIKSAATSDDWVTITRWSDQSTGR
jgi:hypothetical protein